MELMNINSIGFSALSRLGLPARMIARKAKASTKRISTAATVRMCSRIQSTSSDAFSAAVRATLGPVESEGVPEGT